MSKNLIPKNIRIVKNLLKIEGWLGILISFGIFITAIIYPAFVYIFEDFVDEISISYFLYFALTVFVFSIATLIVASLINKRKRYVRNLGLILMVIGNFVFPFGFLFSIPVIIYLFKKESNDWFGIKIFEIKKMPRKIKVAKFFLQFLGWLYVFIGIFLYTLYLWLDYYLDGFIKFDYLVFGVFIGWLIISFLAIVIGRIMKRRKNFSRIIAFFYATYTFFSFPLGTIISILVFMGTLSRDADSWFIN